MLTTYRIDGLSFAYPAAWDLAEQTDEAGHSVTVSSGGSSFCSVTLLPDRPSAESVVEAALAAYRDSYDDFDVYPVECTVASRAAIGRDVDFFCMELINSAWLRAFRTGRCTVLVLYQAGFDELPGARHIFDALCASIECDAGVLLDGGL